MVVDTQPEIETYHLQLFRQAPPWRKIHMLGQMYETMKQLSLQGLRQRYPDADEAELRRRLADLLLGPALAEQVYGALIEESSHAH
jgi:hypothetical protein